ncbi:MAG: hypothetical protein D6B25_06170 [Desulfobulbaceae bacterium]|nr:MAG: hypothetical protein D6B25_06170 [Desulfobulbaceae bacterium]
MMDTSDITFEYLFTFPDGTSKHFILALDPQTLLLKNKTVQEPDWARLTTHQCQCCARDPETTTFCPVALNISHLVSSFISIASYESCTVSCKTLERTVSKKTIVQDGLSSIMGIIMATSGCETMNVLKPMARFHLPFATVDESVFRTASIYLLRQFFIDRETGSGDFQLKYLKQQWSQIEQVNEGILRRIKAANKLDADRNAIVVLNCLAQILTMELDEDLSSLKPIFFIN